MIDYKTLHRKYKISSFLEKEFNEPEFIKIYNFYNDNMDISKMISFKDVKYSNTIYYGYTEDKILIKCHLNTNIFWLDYNKIWKFFEREFYFDYYEIKNLVTSVLESHLNLKNCYVISNNKRLKIPKY